MTHQLDLVRGPDRVVTLEQGRVLVQELEVVA